MKTSFWFEYIENSINPDLIRALAQLDDDTIKLCIATLICKIAGGMGELPTKAPRTEFAKRLIKQGKPKTEVIELTGVSKSLYFMIKKGYKNG